MSVTRQESRRDLVFISHANPEDNDFVLWLAARLASAGYRVWSDVTKLIGGEQFWRDIEDAIRHHSAKVIVVCSTSSITKDGCRKELSLASNIGRQDGITDFIIPVRIDGLDFVNLPIQINDLNVIDFTTGWHGGLGKILKKLDLDAVPRDGTPDTTALSEWSQHLLDINAGFLKEEETLISSLLRIEPPYPSVILTIGNASINPDREAGVSSVGKYLVSFTPIVAVRHLTEVDLVHFFTEGYKDISPKDAQNAIKNLITDSLSSYLETRGMAVLPLSIARKMHFIEHIEGNTSFQKFSVPELGVDGRAKLCGFSSKYGVYWHYTVEFKPLRFYDELVLPFIAHVVFSYDGRDPIKDSAKSFKMRVRFCKSWWQDRWRNMMLAFFARMSEGEQTMDVAVSTGKFLRLSIKPKAFVIAVTAQPPQTDVIDALPHSAEQAEGSRESDYLLNDDIEDNAEFDEDDDDSTSY